MVTNNSTCCSTCPTFPVKQCSYIHTHYQRQANLMLVSVTISLTSVPCTCNYIPSSQGAAHTEQCDIFEDIAPSMSSVWSRYTLRQECQMQPNPQAAYRPQDSSGQMCEGQWCRTGSKKWWMVDWKRCKQQWQQGKWPWNKYTPPPLMATGNEAPGEPYLMLAPSPKYPGPEVAMRARWSDSCQATILNLGSSQTGHSHQSATSPADHLGWTKGTEKLHLGQVTYSPSATGRPTQHQLTLFSLQPKRGSIWAAGLNIYPNYLAVLMAWYSTGSLNYQTWLACRLCTLLTLQLPNLSSPST